MSFLFVLNTVGAQSRLPLLINLVNVLIILYQRYSRFSLWGKRNS